MPQLVKKENLVIVIREYTDNQTQQQKKVYKTVGELITWAGDDGSHYQSFEMWGPTGSTQGKVFEQDNKQSPQQQAQNFQAPPQNYQTQNSGRPQQGYNPNNPQF